jgi:hypothetical protein
MPNASFFSTEHFKAKSTHPDLEKRYSNLLYACHRCNTCKGEKKLAENLHPEESPYGLHFIINPSTGIAEELTRIGDALIRIFCLNAKEAVVWRQKHLALYRLAIEKKDSAKGQSLLKQFFGFPESLPTFEHQSGAVNPYSSRAGLPNWY